MSEKAPIRVKVLVLILKAYRVIDFIGFWILMPVWSLLLIIHGGSKLLNPPEVDPNFPFEMVTDAPRFNGVLLGLGVFIAVIWFLMAWQRRRNARH